MDSLTGLDDDDDFFGSYDAEKVGLSSSALEFDDAQAQPPTEEQLAHLTRFRRPVAAVVAGMALLSIVAFGTHGSLAPRPERELVAHYGSAIPAVTPVTIATRPVKQTAVVSDASSTLVPDALSVLVAQTLAVFMPETSSAVNAAGPALVSSPTLSGAALEPVPPDTTLMEIAVEPDSTQVKTFVSVLTQMCLRPVEMCEAR